MVDLSERHSKTSRKSSVAGRDTQDDRTGLSNGLDMRSLEHCLSDIMRNVGEASQPDHLKAMVEADGHERRIADGVAATVIIFTDESVIECGLIEFRRNDVYEAPTLSKR
uniref:Uncharacterized protein n=1 Tax=Anopheles atroparvus TaxID=41427 RepID=A0A182IVI5_ANOAO